MNYKMIKNILGWILIFEAIFMAVPLITAIIYSESAVISFIVSILICAAVGGLLIMNRPADTTLYSRDGYVIAAASWIALSIFGAFPFYISGAIPSYIDALFETVSGFTTTGASILTEIESLPKSILIWRSFTHWVGGMGVLVFIMAFVSLSGGQNMHIMKAESPGPSVNKLVPRVKNTATILYSLYFILTLTEFFVLLFAGMSVFEALNASFATAGTGGFGIKNDSINSYSSAIQIAITIFMLLFSINFNSYYLLLHRKPKEAFNTEVRVFAAIVISAIAIISLNVYHLFPSVQDAVKHSAFTVASIISTTGFATVDFNLWPELSRTILVLLMFIGACAGSTGGGMKVSRIIILVKSMKNSLNSLIHPKRVQKISIDSHPVDSEVVQNVYAFTVCYIIIFVVSFVVIAFDNHDLITNFTAVVSTMNNIGPGLELVGPTQNFAFFSIPSKLVLIFDMLAGRLEVFPMLILFSRAVWKK